MLQAHGQNFMYAQAKHLKDVSLENLKKCLPTNHIDIIRTELYWAVIEYTYCNYDTALESFQRLENYLLHEATETFPREKTYLKFYIASTQLKLEKKSTDSLSLAKESWIACNNIFGENKTETIHSMQLVALNLENIGSYREALSIYRHCIKLYRNSVADSSANSTEILLTMQNLAGLYISMDKIDKAIQTIRNILKKSRQELHKIDIRFSETGNHLAYCFAMKHQYVIATRIAIDVYNFRKDVYGSENLRTLITLTILADLKLRMFRSEEALLIYEYVHTKVSEKFGKFHRITLTEKCNIAITYSVSRMHDDAVEIFQEIFLLFKGNHAPDDYCNLSQVQYQYGKAYMRMRKPKEALDIFVDLETQLKTRTKGNVVLSSHL
ncbi:unnamed protein product [Orchesella dallaii]|uniref:Uncharacterized protein n=1 Tax=Orchesella dallaii TaxID=48710 RepID=A0ABP1PZQ1_9HEXA